MAIPEFILDATMLASRLGLPPERFMAASAERADPPGDRAEDGEDDDRFRLTLRYLASRVELVIDPQGKVPPSSWGDRMRGAFAPEQRQALPPTSCLIAGLERGRRR
jgi:uncharacterized protein DUF6522